MIRYGFKKVFHQMCIVPLEGIGFSCLMLFLKILPFKQAVALMRALAQRIGPLLPNHHYALRNLQRVLPELSAQHSTILHHMWGNLGSIVAEYAHFNAFKHAPLTMDSAHLPVHKNGSPRIDVEGTAYLDQLIHDQKPGILITAHLGNWEMVALTAGRLGLKFSQLYRPTNNFIVDWWFRRLQYSPRDHILTKGTDGAQKAYALLKRQGHLLLLIDQKLNTGISVPFFGIPAMTAPAVAKFGLRLNCPIIPVQVIRITESHFKVIYHPPLSVTPTGHAENDSYKIMSDINLLLEQWIRAHPEQWFWVHRRWGKN